MKKLIILLCGLAAILSASAQTSVTVSEPRWVNPADKVIIQEYRSHYPATITCSSYEDSLSTLTTELRGAEGLQLRKAQPGGLVEFPEGVFSHSRRVHTSLRRGRALGAAAHKKCEK